MLSVFIRISTNKNSLIERRRHASEEAKKQRQNFTFNDCNSRPFGLLTGLGLTDLSSMEYFRGHHKNPLKFQWRPSFSEYDENNMPLPEWQLA